MGEIFNKEKINDDNQEYFELINRKLNNEIINHSKNNKKNIGKMF